MRGVTASAPAKVNLCLGVGAVRADGFHPLATVYQAIGLRDEVSAAPAATWSLRVDADARIPRAQVPTDDSNLALRAGRLLAEHHGRGLAAALELHKQIPVAGGLAGGSADAAAALVACDAAWGTATPRTELLEIAAELGSDVPFALLGGTALGSGRGEVVTALGTRGECWWVVLESGTGLSTPAVYAELDRMRSGSAVARPRVPEELLEALRDGEVDRLGAALCNDLQPAALGMRPELAGALETGVAHSAHGAVVSGSGPSCLFLCHSRAHAELVADGLRAEGLGPVSIAPGPVPGAQVPSPGGS